MTINNILIIFLASLKSDVISFKITVQWLKVVCIFFSEPGEFSFEQASYHANIITGEVTCDIIRKKGCDGMVTLTYNTM